MTNFPPVRGLSFGSKIAIQASIINTPTLSTLTISANQFAVGNAQGTIIGIVQGLTSGSILLLTNSFSGAVQLVSGVLQVGPTPPTGTSTFNIQLTEVLSNASNSPNITSLSILANYLAIPVNITIPTISGTAQVGQTLTAATNGTWTNSPSSYTYQWNDGGVPIGGATANTYVPVSGDIGDLISVSVTAINGLGPSLPATSAATSAVIDIIPTINTAASIPGTPRVGSPITAIDAIWNNSVTSLAYQWKVAGVNGTGAGATTLTYTPVSGDLGSTLTITVTATNTGGTSAPSTSAASAAVQAALTANSTPYVILLAA